MSKGLIQYALEIRMIIKMFYVIASVPAEFTSCSCIFFSPNASRKYT
jgi:hypothetical protein